MGTLYRYRPFTAFTTYIIYTVIYLFLWKIVQSCYHASLDHLYLPTFVRYDALRPSQQFFSHVETISYLYGLNQ